MVDLKLEEDYAKLAYETKIYRKQLTILQREIERITLTSIDLTNALNTIEGLKKGEALVPIGGGSFAKAQISDVNILVPIGGGYLAEMDKKNAEDRMRNRIEATKTAVQRLSQEFGNISTRLEEVTAQLKELEKRMAIEHKVEEEAKEDYV